ncbi:hypothetical protein BH09ACT5_BH09ACT5_14550 [soil metagenome]
MPTLTRVWLAFAAIGTGLIHVALVLGSPVGLAIPLGILGLAEFGWGVLTFARETVLVPRVALAIAVVPVGAWTLLLVVSSIAETPGPAASLGFLPLAVASLFELFAAAVLGVHLRRRSPDAPPPRLGLVRYLLGLVAGALVVAALTAPALASTSAGHSVAPGGDPSDLFNLPDHDGH